MQNEHPHLSLVEHFKSIADPRVDRTKDHDLLDILVIAVCALLCAAESFNDMEDFGKAKEDWFRTFLTLRNGIPSHDTFNRVFAALDPKEFLNCFLRWTQSLRQAVAQEIVALDGKALRRALNGEENPKYVVSAWAESNNLVLGQLKVDEKSNQITAVPELLRVLELAGCIVTVDAMGCQKKIAKEVIEADADYVLALKGNQETVHAEVKSFLDATLEEKQKKRPKGAAIPRAAASLQELETVEKDHGRLETRRYYQSAELEWCGSKQVGGVTVGGHGGSSARSERENHDRTTLLPEQFGFGCGHLCPSRTRPLGSGEQTALGDGRLFSGRPEPSTSGLCRGELSDSPTAGTQLTQTGTDQKTWNPGQTT